MKEAVQGVVKIIRPVRVEPVAAARRGVHQPRIVQIALRDQHEAAIELLAQSPHRGGELFENVRRLEAEDGVHRVEPQSVEAVVAQPHERVVDDEAAHLVAAGRRRS